MFGTDCGLAQQPCTIHFLSVDTEGSEAESPLQPPPLSRLAFAMHSCCPLLIGKANGDSDRC